MWTKYFKTSPAEEDDVEMTREGEGSVDPSRDEDDCEKLIRLANESRHLGGMSKHRLINLRSGYWKNQFLESPMTKSVRKTSFTIDMSNCQGTFMSTKRTLMS